MTNKPIEEMSKEELEAYEENLDKELKIRDLKKKEQELKLQKEQEKQTAKEEQMKLLKQEALDNIYKEHPEFKPVAKIDVNKPENTNSAEDQPMLNFYKGYLDRHKTIETKSGYENVLAETKKERYQIWEGGWKEASLDRLFTNTNSDDGCDDEVGAWSPEDVYSKIVWETFVCKADLFKICVKGLAINPGDGLGVQIRAYGAFGDPSALNACECASCASISFSTYSLTLQQYNLEAIICEKDIWDVGGILMDSYLKSMSDSWARWFDAQIYSELETATPGTTETLTNALSCTPSISGSCCTDTSLVELYNGVHNVVANMREGNGLAGPYEPDYIIISPSVAAIFKRMQTPTPMPWMGDVSFGEDGRLKKISGLKVIEYCGANSCCTTSGQEVAIIIDSRRAVGAVFGERPKTYKFFQSNCNSYRIDQWAFFAVGELDTDAIGHIVNP